jgi:hypothetical protein
MIILLKIIVIKKKILQVIKKKIFKVLKKNKMAKFKFSDFWTKKS